MYDQEIPNERMPIPGPSIDSSITNNRPTEDEEEAGPSHNNSRPNQSQNVSLTPVSKENKEWKTTPDQVRPFPKAELRKKRIGGRKKGKCAILTDTPEKLRIEAEVLARKVKLEKKEKKICKRKIIETNLLKLRTKKTKIIEDSSDAESYQSEDLCDDGGMSPLEIESEDETENEGLKIDLEGNNVNELDFLLVKLANKKSIKYFVAQVSEKISLTEFKVSFLKKRDGSFTFVEPDIPDMSSVSTEDCIFKLPQPSIVGGTSRAINVFRFKFNFTKYNMG